MSKRISPATIDPSGSTIRPESVRIKVESDDSVGAVSLRQQARKARHINEVEGLFFAREHRDGRSLERHHVLPSLLQRKRVVLREGGESEIDQEAEPPDHLIFQLDQGFALAILHTHTPKTRYDESCIPQCSVRR